MNDWTISFDGALRVASNKMCGLLVAWVWTPGLNNGTMLRFHAVGNVWRAEADGVNIAIAALKITRDNETGHQRLRISITTNRTVRVELLLSPESSSGNAFHILPGVLFGDNNLPVSGPGHFPNLTDTESNDTSCSRAWRMRTDRAAAPVAMALLPDGGHLALAAPPYLNASGRLIRTGLVAELPGTVGVSIGYRNAPYTFVNKDLFSEPTEDYLPAGTDLNFDIDLFLGNNTGRHVAFKILRELYPLYHQPPSSTSDTATCIQAIADTIVRDSWAGDRQVFQGVQVKGLPDQPLYRKVGGRAIAWVGGANVAYPLLQAGFRLNNPEWVTTAQLALNKIAANTNPANGLFFDAFTESGNPTVNCWWSVVLNRDRHSAYTNAEATYYLLQAAWLTQTRTGTSVTAWTRPALAALETMLKLQRDDGHYGFAYEVDRVAVADWEGFAGCWWVPAMCAAYELTRDRRYLHSAQRAMDLYAVGVGQLEVWGTPMDAWKGNDEEGVLAFIRGARLLHQATGNDRYLDMLRLGAEYEFLWRYLFNAKPEAEPLKSAGWHSCGGSLTSVSNPHIHPMGLLIAPDLEYLADKTGDAHVASRLQDSLVWARNCLQLYPDKTGYGRFGWTGERYCPSDGLLIAKYADGSPASTELGLNLWAASAMLEGLMGVRGQSSCFDAYSTWIRNEN